MDETSPREESPATELRRRDVLQIGAVAAAISAGAAIVGTSRPAFAAAVPKPFSQAYFAVKVAGVSLSTATAVRFLPQLFAVTKSSSSGTGTSYTYDPSTELGGDLDVVIETRKPEPVLDNWFAAVVNGTDDGTTREVVVESWNPSFRSLLGTWLLRSLPLRRVQRDGTSAKWPFVEYTLRGSM